MSTGLDPIEHVVVVMMENRSLDNLLGFLYEKEGNKAPHIIPEGSSPYYEGLIKEKYCNRSSETRPSFVILVLNCKYKQYFRCRSIRPVCVAVLFVGYILTRYALLTPGQTGVSTPDIITYFLT